MKDFEPKEQVSKFCWGVVMTGLHSLIHWQEGCQYLVSQGNCFPQALTVSPSLFSPQAWGPPFRTLEEWL